jgi:serine/threonine protein kinase
MNTTGSGSINTTINGVTPEKQEKLGEGGYGTVVASPNGTATKLQPIGVASFREYTVGCHTLNHPCVAKLCDIKLDDTPGLYTPNVSFNMSRGMYTLNEKKGLLSTSRVTSIMYQILLGVHHIHTRGIIHRDIKPANIIMFKGDQPQIIDFGLACMADKTINPQCTHTGSVQSAWFRSPEVVLLQPYGKPVDIWSCGGVLLSMLGDDFIDMAIAYWRQGITKKQNCKKCANLCTDCSNCEGSMVANFGGVLTPRCNVESKFVFRFYSYILGCEGFEEEVFKIQEFKTAANKGYVFRREWLNKNPRRLSTMVGDIGGDHPLVDLVTQMLAWDPSKRITAANALRHPCFASVCHIKVTRPLPDNREYRWASSVVDNHDDVNLNMRNIVCTWLYEVFVKRKISLQLLVCTYRVINEWLTTHTNISRYNIQLVGCAAAYTVIALYSNNELPLREWVVQSDNSFTISQLRSLTVEMLKEIDIYTITKEFFRPNIPEDKWALLVYLVGTTHEGGKSFSASHILVGSCRKIKNWNGTYYGKVGRHVRLFENSVRSTWKGLI